MPEVNPADAQRFLNVALGLNTLREIPARGQLRAVSAVNANFDGIDLEVSTRDSLLGQSLLVCVLEDNLLYSINMIAPRANQMGSQRRYYERLRGVGGGFRMDQTRIYTSIQPYPEDMMEFFIEPVFKQMLFDSINLSHDSWLGSELDQLTTIRVWRRHLSPSLKRAVPDIEQYLNNLEQTHPGFRPSGR